MLKFENVEVVGLEAAIRGMRNPMNSWDKSDSGLTCPNGEYNMGIERCSQCVVDVMSCENVPYFAVGPNDLKTMKNLSNGGPVHGKFKRMIAVYVDVTAPLYWWKEFDTYKIGTVANSCSTMHKIHDKEFVLDDFSHEWLSDLNLITETHVWGDKVSDVNFRTNSLALLKITIDLLNYYRELFVKHHDKNDWWQMIQLLPSSYNQRRTVMLNYEVLTSIYRDRRNHKLDEWHVFCSMIDILPCNELITAKPTYV